MRGKEVRCDDLDHLFFIVRERAEQVLGGCQMPGTPLSLRERLVGNVSNEVLKEAVLAVLGRARVGLHTEHLLPREGDEHRLEVGVGARRAANASLVKVLPSTAASWSSRRSSAGSPSSRAAISACSVSGTSSASISPVSRYTVPFLDEQAAVEQHPHGLDRVERDALGTSEDAVAHPAGRPGTRPASSSSMACCESGSR